MVTHGYKVHVLEFATKHTQKSYKITNLPSQAPEFV